jgi:hypothetical protein
VATVGGEAPPPFPRTPPYLGSKEIENLIVLSGSLGSTEIENLIVLSGSLGSKEIENLIVFFTYCIFAVKRRG